MAVIDPARRTIEAKLVYFGTALGGKTTNLLVLHRLAEPDQKQKLISLNTTGDRTLFFDLLPFDLGTILDYQLKLKLYTVPGQPEYNETRRVVLAAADGIVFVADSDPARQAENARSVNFLKLNLRQNLLDPEEIPLVFQYNKRDVPGALASSVLEAALNWRHMPYFMATAIHGKKVLETFEEAVCRIVTDLAGRTGARARAGSTEEDIRHGVRVRLRPLYQRLPAIARSEDTIQAGASRVVVDSGRAPTKGEKPLDTQDLLMRSLQHEMQFLNQMLEREAATPDAASAPVLSLDALTAAYHRAAGATQLTDAIQPFLELACEVAGADRGSVLAMCLGDGALTEVALHNLFDDPLNTQPLLGGEPTSRRIAREGRPLFGAELARLTHSGVIQNAAAPSPRAAIPITALGHQTGLICLYSEAGQAEPTAAQRAALEVVVLMLSLIMAVLLESTASTASAASAGDTAEIPVLAHT